MSTAVRGRWWRSGGWILQLVEVKQRMYLEVVAISILGILFFAACAYFCASRWPNCSNVVRLVWGLGVVGLTLFGMSSAQDYPGYASLWREACVAMVVQLILIGFYNRRFGVR
jgi:hypothetical protein